MPTLADELALQGRTALEGEANEATLNAMMVAVLIATSASVTASTTAAVISS